MHTNASDGEFSPEKVVDKALRKGLRAIAITDHDTVDGIKRAEDHAKNIEIVPGIEISCDEEKRGYKEVHMLGLLIDHKNKDLIKFCEDVKIIRINQKKEMIEKLQNLGYEINFEEVKNIVGSSFGRPHIAKILMEKYPEEFFSIPDVFDKYLGVGKPAFVERKNKVDLKGGIDIVKKAKGIPILAHPGVYASDADEIIHIFKELGGEGIETYYPYHIVCPQLNIDEKENMKLIKNFQDLAKSLNLIESGGNDFHGSDRNTMAAVDVPDSVLDKLKAWKNKHL